MYYENLKTYRKHVHPSSKAYHDNLTLLASSRIHPSTHPSVHPSTHYFWGLSKMLQTSVYVPLNTSACTSVNRDQYWFTSFFSRLNLHKVKGPILSVHLLSFDKCVDLCNPNPIKMWTITNMPESSLMPLPSQSLPPLPPHPGGCHCPQLLPS